MKIIENEVNSRFQLKKCTWYILMSIDDAQKQSDQNLSAC